MSFVAVAIGGAGLVTGALGYAGAKSAANTQAQSAQSALNFQQGVFNTQQQNYSSASDYIKSTLQPYITAGNGATGTLSQLANGNTSSFFMSPDYQFAQQYGQQGLTNYENAQGLGLSGGALKDVSQFNQGLATQQYGNYFNRLMQIAQLGSGAASNAASGIGSLTGNMNNTSGNMAGTIGNTIQGVGQAQASGIVGGTNAITGGINNGISNSLLASALGKSPSAYGNSGSYASLMSPNNTIFGSGNPLYNGG